MKIRLARATDAAAVQAIYGPVVENTAITFEVVVPSLAEIEERITSTLQHWPWLVATENDVVIGYAYSYRHRERSGYQWTADISCYIHEDWQGKRVGTALYQQLFTLLTKQGYCNVCAGIALPNPGSVKLHEGMGMYHIGTYRHVGYKLGTWPDVGWWQGDLQRVADAPVSPRPWFEVIMDTTLVDNG